MTSFRRVNVSAPSKLILHGEHAVVYGKTAVAASLGLRTRITVSPRSDQTNKISVDFMDVGLRRSWRVERISSFLLLHNQRPILSPSSSPESFDVPREIDPGFVDVIIRFLEEEKEDTLNQDESTRTRSSLICFLYLFSLVCAVDGGRSIVNNLHLSVESDIPVGAGLGSSAALSVCLAAALLSIRDQCIIGNRRRVRENSDIDENTKNNVCRLAHLSEQILHGRLASGIDNAVSTFGGFIHYKKSAFMRNLTLPLHLPPFRVLLVDTKVPRQTRSLVERVALAMKEDPKNTCRIIDAIDQVGVAFLETLAMMHQQQSQAPERTTKDLSSSYARFNCLIDENQKLLQSLNVSHPRLEEVCRIAFAHGLHAKLTGAGGGGYAFIFLPPSILNSDNDPVFETKTELEKNNFACREVCLGISGVEIKVDCGDNDSVMVK